jgi:uncharacterized membrane protein
MRFVLDDKYLQTFAHLYRAEINRLTIYRQRLDIISNWYITLLTTVLVLYLGNTIIPHNMILILFIPNIIFSCIEARRYRYYMLSQYRTRLIEKGFYGDMLKDHTVINIETQHELVSLNTHYKKELYESMMSPKYNISFVCAWIIRFRRNYIWLIYFIILCWVLKLSMNDLIMANIVLVSTLSTSIFVLHACIGIVKSRQEIDI